MQLLLHSFTPFSNFLLISIIFLETRELFKVFEEWRLGTMVFSLVDGKFVLIGHIKKTSLLMTIADTKPQFNT